MLTTRMTRTSGWPLRRRRSRQGEFVEVGDGVVPVVTGLVLRVSRDRTGGELDVVRLASAADGVHPPGNRVVVRDANRPHIAGAGAVDKWPVATGGEG